MKRLQNLKKNTTYQVSIAYSGIFYLLLVAWTIICVFVLSLKVIKSGWPLGQLLMIAFVLAYTWFFSLAISYKIQIDNDRNILLTSLRRILKVKAQEIEIVEGPRMPFLHIGFLRFRLEREKAYLFCILKDDNLQRILMRIRAANPDMKFKSLSAYLPDHLRS